MVGLSVRDRSRLIEARRWWWARVEIDATISASEIVQPVVVVRLEIHNQGSAAASAHFAVRGLMHEAALHADEDPDRLSFLHAVRVVRRKLPLAGAISPSAENSLS